MQYRTRHSYNDDTPATVLKSRCTAKFDETRAHERDERKIQTDARIRVAVRYWRFIAFDADATCWTIFLPYAGHGIELTFWFGLVADEMYSRSRIVVSVKQIR